MKKIIAVLMASMLFSAPVMADWDAEMEAREAAERAAEQQAEQAKQRAAQQQMDAAQAKANSAIMAEKRKTLGAAANGKSDAEVNKLYDAKIAQDTAAANNAAAQAKGALSQGEGAAALKQVTGKSMQEMENMSDEELEAMAKEMEKKYGQ